MPLLYMPVVLQRPSREDLNRLCSWTRVYSESSERVAITTSYGKSFAVKEDNLIDVERRSIERADPETATRLAAHRADESQATTT